MKIEIEEKLMMEAVESGEIKSHKLIIEQALKEYIHSRNQLSVMNYFGQIEYFEDYFSIGQ